MVRHGLLLENKLEVVQEQSLSSVSVSPSVSASLNENHTGIQNVNQTKPVRC